MHVALVSCDDLPDWEVDDKPLVKAFEARGATVSVVPWNAGVDWSTFDAALVRTTWDYWHHRDAFVAWAEQASESTRLYNDARVVRWNTDKSYLRELERLGVPIAPSAWFDRGSEVDLARTCADRGWTKGFLKPLVGASASDTMRFTMEEAPAAQRFLEDCLKRVDMVLQPYLASVEDEGELSCIVLDGKPTHAVRKVPVPGDYRVQDDYGASDMPIELSAELSELSERTLLAAQQALGGVDLVYARVDALRLADGSLVLNELEVVEPSLFFRHAPHAAAVLAHAVLRRAQ